MKKAIERFIKHRPFLFFNPRWFVKATHHLPKKRVQQCKQYFNRGLSPFIHSKQELIESLVATPLRKYDVVLKMLSTKLFKFIIDCHDLLFLLEALDEAKTHKTLQATLPLMTGTSLSSALLNALIKCCSVDATAYLLASIFNRPRQSAADRIHVGQLHLSFDEMKVQKQRVAYQTLKPFFIEYVALTGSMITVAKKLPDIFFHDFCTAMNEGENRFFLSNNITMVSLRKTLAALSINKQKIFIDVFFIELLPLINSHADFVYIASMVDCKQLQALLTFQQREKPALVKTVHDFLELIDTLSPTARLIAHAHYRSCLASWCDSTDTLIELHASLSCAQLSTLLDDMGERIMSIIYHQRQLHRVFDKCPPLKAELIGKALISALEDRQSSQPQVFFLSRLFCCTLSAAEVRVCLEESAVDDIKPLQLGH